MLREQYGSSYDKCKFLIDIHIALCMYVWVCVYVLFRIHLDEYLVPWGIARRAL